jgi:hypothetical protein
LTRIPFFSFGNIIAISAADFEIRTVSKSEQRTAVGCGRLQWKSRQLIAPDAAFHMITNAIATPMTISVFAPAIAMAR